MNPTQEQLDARIRDSGQTPVPQSNSSQAELMVERQDGGRTFKNSDGSTEVRYYQKTPYATTPPTVPNTITSSSLAPVIPIQLPTPVQDTQNYSGMVAGGNAAIMANTPTMTAPDGWDATTYANFKKANPNLEPNAQDTAMMQSAGNPSDITTQPWYKKIFNSLMPDKPTSGVDTYNTLYGASGIDAKQADVNAKATAVKTAQSKLAGINAKLAGLNAEAQAIPVQTQQDATGRGITTAGLTPTTTGKLRENALKALPLQAEAIAAQAEVASAQGDQQLSQSLLTQAQDHLDKVFSIYQTDATNQYNYQKDLYDRVIAAGDKQEARQAEEKKTQEANNFQLMRDNINNAQAIAKTAMENGQADVASKITQLDPKSATYSQDLATLQGKIKTGNTLDDQYKKMQIAKLAKDLNGGANSDELLSIADAKALNVPYGTTKGQAIAKNLIPGQSTTKSLSLAQAQSNITQVNDLLTNGALSRAVGPNIFARSSGLYGGGKDIFTGEKQNFLAGMQQLTSQLSLDSLINAKANGATFGALSEGELKLLSSSATKLDKWAIKDKSGNVTGYNASEKSFKAELDKINNFAKLDYIVKGGDPIDVGAQLQPDGTVWSKNSDGTLTQIK